MTNTITLTNPKTGETWTSGGRGRRKKWVLELEAAGTVIPRKAPIPVALRQELPKVPGQLRAWRWIGQDGEEASDSHFQSNVGIIMIGHSAEDAINHANLTMVNPISKSEFDVCWSELRSDMVVNLSEGGVNVTKPGIWSAAKDDECWVQRPPRIKH
jgi:hypothetical protein